MLGVQLNGKEKGFGPEFEAIGGALLGEGPGSLGPGAATLLDSDAGIAELKRCFEAGGLVDAEFFESYKGRYEWVGRFLVNGPARVCPAHRWCARRIGEKDLLAKNFAPMVQDPLDWHGGWLAPGDASTTDGWGVVNNQVGMSGIWEDATKEAIERNAAKAREGDRVSISPLELMTVAFLLCVVMEASGPIWEEKKGDRGVIQLVMRCDNKSAVDVILSRRPHSPAMRVALDIVELVESNYGVRVRLEHIKTKENVVADALSHDNWEKAGRMFETAGTEFKLGKASDDLRGPIEGMSFREFAVECERKVCQAIARDE